MEEIKNTELQVTNPVTPEVTGSEQTNALIIHLSGLSNLVIPFGNIIVPLVLWQAMKSDSKFVDHHGKEALNFNLSFLLYGFLAVLLFAGSLIGTLIGGVDMDAGEGVDILPVLLGSSGFIVSLLFLGVMFIIRLVFIIIAVLRSGKGEWYRYPMTIRFIR